MSTDLGTAIRGARDAKAVLACLHDAAAAGTLDDAALLAARGALLDQAIRCTARPPIDITGRLRRRRDRAWGRVTHLAVREGRWFITVDLPEGAVEFPEEAMAGEAPEWERWAYSSACFPDRPRARALGDAEVRDLMLRTLERSDALAAIREAVAAVLGWDRRDALDLRRRLEALRSVYARARWHGHGYCLFGTEIREWLEPDSDDPSVVAVDAAGRRVRHPDLDDGTDWTSAPFEVEGAAQPDAHNQE